MKPGLYWAKSKDDGEWMLVRVQEDPRGLTEYTMGWDCGILVNEEKSEYRKADLQDPDGKPYDDVM